LYIDETTYNHIIDSLCAIYLPLTLCFMSEKLIFHIYDKWSWLFMYKSDICNNTSNKVIILGLLSFNQCAFICFLFFIKQPYIINPSGKQLIIHLFKSLFLLLSPLKLAWAIYVQLWIMIYENYCFLIRTCFLTYSLYKTNPQNKSPKQIQPLTNDE
jgi:hypothetical protein